MEEAQIKRSLDIFWNGRIVGRYDLLDDGSELFSYDGSYLESADAVSISHSLPLRADPYGKRQLRPFFAGLLPEESQRQRIAAYLGLAESDDFSMLEAIGGECAGALEIIPRGKSPRGNTDALSPCDDHRLLEIVKSLPYRPMLAGESTLSCSTQSLATQTRTARTTLCCTTGGAAALRRATILFRQCFGRRLHPRQP